MTLAVRAPKNPKQYQCPSRSARDRRASPLNVSSPVTGIRDQERVPSPVRTRPAPGAVVRSLRAGPCAGVPARRSRCRPAPSASGLRAGRIRSGSIRFRRDRRVAPVQRSKHTPVPGAGPRAFLGSAALRRAGLAGGGAEVSSGLRQREVE